MKKSIVHRIITMAVVASAFTLTYAASAANIGFVKVAANAMDPFDQGWINRLASQGHAVTVFDQAAGGDPNVLNMNLVIISQDVASGTAWSNFGNLARPILAYEYGIYDNIFSTSTATAGEGNSSTLLANGINIMMPSHPLAAGLSGSANVSIYSGAGASISYLPVSDNASGTQVIAVSADSPGSGLFLLLEAGATGENGQTWSALRIGVPVYDSWNPALITADGWRILDNCIAYALVPEPSSFALLGLGMTFFLARRQRR